MYVRGFTCRLCKFSSLCWYDVIRTTAASWSSPVVSRSLATTSIFGFSRIFVCMTGILIFVGMMTSIPYVRVNSDTTIGFRLVVL